MKQSHLPFVEPMECLMVSKLPEGPEWSYEIKLDGYRAQALCDGIKTQLLSRNGKDLGNRFPSVVAALARATELGAKDLLNNRMAYVAVSRGAQDAQLFTNDREKLPAALGHEVSQQSAHVPGVAKVQAPEIAPKQEHSHGFDEHRLRAETRRFDRIRVRARQLFPL